MAALDRKLAQSIRPDDFSVRRFLGRLPPEVRGSLSAHQLRSIVRALDDIPTTSHLIDLRASVPLVWRRYYVRLMVGRERRSRARLAAEGQLAVLPSLAVLGLLASVLIATLIGFAVLAYLLKSALGINLFAQPSALHTYYLYVFRGVPLP